ncbi:hypothetical protein PR202_gb09705 [Eleusine coracana subsp. coracana]|uniref:Uncharacterized protein n=1 Tax=Eleusine coracana subsp. coracana TaxID=191504 RepID=A0AAV5EIH5_ELECO|nr:hypothetical protein PR202_gb09705 [Eleusine coracana subsp. coracana]
MEAVKDMAALENADATMDVAIKVASPENVVNHDVLIVPNSDEEEDAAFEIKCRRGRNRARARKVASKFDAGSAALIFSNSHRPRFGNL